MALEDTKVYEAIRRRFLNGTHPDMWPTVLDQLRLEFRGVAWRQDREDLETDVNGILSWGRTRLGHAWWSTVSQLEYGADRVMPVKQKEKEYAKVYD